MDAFAVAFAMGIRSSSLGLQQIIKLAWFFGFFQAIMPIAGWYAALSIRSYVELFDHWIAFALLVAIGGKMIIESFELKKSEEEEDTKGDPTRAALLIVLSIATSIDALAVGFSLALLRISVWFPSFIIGIVAFLFTGFGVYLGKWLFRFPFFSRYAEILGGLILFTIGVRILIDHGVF